MNAETRFDWTGRRVLVTGAAGFVGSHLVERLVSLGAGVHAYVHYNSRGDEGWLDRMRGGVAGEIEVVAGDLADQEHVGRAVRGMDTVFHLGAQISIPNSYAEPGLFVATNVGGTFNVLAGCREHGVRRLVHTSTSEVYGTALTAPMTEEHPLQAQSPYAATKIGADKLVESYHRSFGVPAVTLRPFNTFGPRQSTRAVIPVTITQALWADRIALGSLHPLRDFNYVGNTVDAYLLAATVDGVEGEVFNVGTGRSIAIGDMARLVCRLVERDVEVVTRDERRRPPSSEVDRLECGWAKAERGLSWRPAVDLEEGLRRTIEWIAGHREAFEVGRYAI
jgi:NAD dependent epimerase/dehydratase